MKEDPYILGKKLKYKDYMIERYIEMIGKEGTIKLMRFNEKPLRKSIRLNSLRAPIKYIAKLLEAKGVKLEEVQGLPEARTVLKSPVPIGATPEYLNGYYFLQGKNSLYPTLALEPNENDIVADMAAAPGGKTTHMAQLMRNKGIIIAFEISANRCRALRSNIARMGVKNTIVYQYDARKLNKIVGSKFDKILLDAPCSGSGVIVSDPTRKYSKDLEDLWNYSKYQISFLKAGIEVLKPGGALVYCTCSLEPEENELVINEVLKEHEELELAKIDIPGKPGLTKFGDQEFLKELENARRLYPHETNGEGFFIAKVMKNG